ncbi:ABC-three component system protein [Xanthomonas axonopodis pv. phyllanthi]|uniref:ABC-three component system protein n=1 Tax=Xanthomonas axonopodis TaxID=53413 RepID=UPI00355896E1
MEVLDDVAQQHPEKGVRLIQSKSALTANPVSNRAKSLWKTLSNWIEASATWDFELEKTVFEIYVSRPVCGAIVQSFADAKTLEAAHAAITQAQLELWGEGPDFPLKDELAEDIAPYVERVFNAHPTSLAQIICNFHLTCGSGSPHADVEAIIRSHPVSASKVTDIADHMCGIVKRRVDEQLEAGRPAVIGRDEFAGWYATYVRKVDRDMVLLSRAKMPSEDESRDLLPKIFVQQLEIIGLSFEDKLEAVSDYLMASADRTDWAVRGEVDETSFDELDLVLKRNWRNKRRAGSIQNVGKEDDLQGQALYSECMQIEVDLQAMEPPGHFVPGCLHRLADDLSIGWHPTYEKQFTVKKVA